MELEFSKVDLIEIIRETIRRMQPFIEQREITVRVMDSSPVITNGNATTLGELLVNLLKNALAYTPTGGSVTIAARQKRGQAILSISDTGIGIPAKDIPNIFEPFYRGENAYSERSKKRGSGIGLAIVKEIAELHGARVSVESELGKGTTFFIRFAKIKAG
jgi:signal transduction histidine kinase